MFSDALAVIAAMTAMERWISCLVGQVWRREQVFYRWKRTVHDDTLQRGLIEVNAKMSDWECFPPNEAGNGRRI